MAARFTYSRWDGTQRGFDLDADALLAEITDDLLYHGDVNAALRRMMNQGLRDRDGKQVQGLREMMQRLREARQERLDRDDLGSVFKEIADNLDDIVDEERHSLSADDDRNFQLDMLPDDLAGKVRELSSYQFESSEAQQRFNELVERLREQMLQQVVDRASSAMNDVTPESIQRMKDMMAALNQMIERREQGLDPGFDEFMQEYGDFFPDQPQSLDELLEQMAERMAAAQAMFDSMTPEQRQQLQELSEQLLGDMDLQWQVDQLGRSLQQMFPQAFGRQYQFRGDQPMNFGQGMQTMMELGQLDRLENLLRNTSNPAGLAEADIDQVRDLLGDDAAQSLEQLAQLTKQLEEAGLIRQKEGRVELTPRGLRRLGNNALRDLFTKLVRDQQGQHQIHRQGIGHERTYTTKPYEYGDPFTLDLERTIRNAITRQGPSTPVRLSPDDFEITTTEQLTRSSTVLMLDLSMSMPMRDNFLPAKKVTMALHSLITSQFPRDFLGLIGFSSTAYEIRPDALPEVSWDYEYGTNMQHGFALARRMLAKESGTKQIIMITDGEPTAHITPEGEVYFNYPPVRETVELTLREVARCTKEGIRINTFMLDADAGLKSFVERLTELNRGRAFFTSPQTLGDYVLVDFMEHKRQQARGSGRRAG
jgi:uncharacterized protein with von Willebrand factor type A (vWA) domain